MLVCGLDEVGRGPLAGPVVASAVVLDENHGIIGLTDSKKLSEKKREELVPIIRERCISWGTGWVWQTEIDELNIHAASLLAMMRAFDDLMERKTLSTPLRIMVDGKFLPDIGTSKHSDFLQHCELQAIIKGDSLIEAISAASIIAKVTRDTWMCDHAAREPGYGFEKHKGYPTKAHKEAIRLLGPSSIQRMSFRY